MYSNKSKLGETQPKNSRNGYKNGEFGAGETAQWLRAVTPLPEDLGSISRTHMVAHNYMM